MPPYQRNAIDLRSALKVDFWVLKPFPFEREMFARRQRIVLLGKSAWIATAEDVILHKLYWNQVSPSDRQLTDAAGVLAVQAGALDLGYLRRVAAEIGVTHRLEDLLSGGIGPKST